MKFTKSSRSGFTLVEMLVVITIIGILAAITFPALSAARESARNATCQNNLHQFGIGLNAYASRFDRFCSGAFDWRRDGAVTEYGWVADLVNQGTITGQMLCPSNQAKLHEAYDDLLNGSGPIFTIPQTPMLPDNPTYHCNPRVAGKEQNMLPDGTIVMNPCRNIIVNGLSGEERRALVEAQIYTPGYNTNYVATWTLVRGEPVLNEFGQVTFSGVPYYEPSPINPNNPNMCVRGIKERTCSIGPLTLRQADSNGAPMNTIPFLGCAKQTGNFSLAAMGKVRAGEQMAESYTDGPVINSTMNAPYPPDNTPYQGADGWWAIWAKQTRQDYRDFGPVHGGTRRGSCNILFADGTVRVFNDDSGDGFLNNGFDPTVFSGSGAIDYKDAAIELPLNEVFSGWTVRPQS